MTILAEKFSKIIYNGQKKISDKTHQLRFVIQSLSWLQSLLEEYKLVSFVLHSPIIQKEEKMALVTRIAKNSNFELAKEASNLFIILIRMEKLRILSDIILSLKKKCLKTEGISEVSLHFASKPSSDQLKTLEILLASKYKLKSQVNVKIHPKIVGGFIAFFDGKMLDASLNNAFEDLASLSI